MDKLISIIIPFHGETDSQLVRVVSSINNQIGIDFSQIEVLLSGDGVAADRLSAQLFKNLENVQPRIFSTKESGGAGVAHQHGIERTSGRYFMFIDADDVLNDVVVLRDFIDLIQKQGDHQIIVAQYTQQSRQADGTFRYYPSAERDWKAAYAKLFNRSYINQLRLTWLPDLRIYEDTYYVGVACMLATDIVYLHRSVYMWLYNDQSTVRKNGHEFNYQLHTWCLSYRHTLDILRRERPALWAVHFYEFIAGLFFRERQFPAVDPIKYRAELKRLLAENRGLWTDTGTSRIAERMVAMTGRGGEYAGWNLDGSAAYFKRLKDLLYEAFLETQKA